MHAKHALYHLSYTPNYSTAVWMGYPNKRVSMTDVHGEPQQGGYLPAEIWHAYMSQVVGNHCVQFPSPKQPISYQPFFGHFATTGQAAVSQSEESESSGGKGSKHAHGLKTPSEKEAAGGTGGGTGTSTPGAGAPTPPAAGGGGPTTPTGAGGGVGGTAPKP